jgi:CelD/BcsL family acetyltransferase involved in cellulose biosynthesis
MPAGLSTPLPDRSLSGTWVASEPLTPAEDYQFELILPAQLDPQLKSDWDALRGANPAFRSPFFSWRFIEQVAQLVPSVEIGVARLNGRAVAIFPFQRHRGRTGRPVGVGVNDAHGLIARIGHGPSLREMMRHCGLSSFPFHAAPGLSTEVAQFELGRTRSFLADLTIDPRGYEYFLRETRNTIDKQAQKTRRMIRDLGPLRFEFDCQDPRMLDRLIDLKCEQYQRTHTYNILGVPWIQRLLRNFHTQTDSPVRGILNVLFAGEKPVALHFGILEGELLHYWFPVFDPAAGFGSPGTQLFLDVARQARERGIVAIDMGYGEQAYKTKLTNVISEMSYGLVDTNPLRCIWHRQKLALRELWRGSNFRQAVKPYARRLLPWFGRDHYRA